MSSPDVHSTNHFTDKFVQTA